jgi:nicotinate-nucleotide pyrophosphorylase (carboxylating)
MYVLNIRTAHGMYDPFIVDRSIDHWLAEDIGHGDLTTQLMTEAGQSGHFYMNARQDLVLAGIEVAARVFDRYDPSLAINVHRSDGQRVAKGTRLMDIGGRARSVLTCERVALNIVQRLSGIATETARYVSAIEGTSARLLDTRKTTPGLRMLEKHAVTCGGGFNHRLGLDNGVLIKDNHIVVAGSVAAAIARARRGTPVLTKVEVECDTLQQVREALAAGADLLLLDNMSPDQLREAVSLVAGRIPLEASGGIDLQTIRDKAETGVDYLSTSKITQSAPAVDIGLDEA